MPASRYRPETRLVQAGTLRSRIRRDLRGAVPHAGLRLRELRAGRAALQERGAGLPVLALRQPDGRDVRGAHGGVRGRRGRARDRDRHGGGDGRAARAGEGGRSCRRRQGAVRLLPLRGGGFPAALRRRLDAGRRHRPEAVEERGAAEHEDLLPRDPDQSQPGDHRHRRGGEDRACGGRDAGGRQCVRDAAVPATRSRSARTASSIRRPSTSTARAAASAAWCSARRSSSRTTCTT